MCCKMYNEELKRRYIEEQEKILSVSSRYLEVQFEHSEETENELDKDVSNWTVYEIVEYYKLANFSSYESLLCLNSIFSKYTQFCLENSLVVDNQNHYLEISKELLLNCVNKAMLEKKIVSDDDILGWVNELPNPSDQFALLFTYETGKSRNFIDILNAKPGDINREKKTIKLTSGNEVQLSDRLIAIIDECVEEKMYYSITGKGEKKVSLVDEGFIIKNYPNMRSAETLTEFARGRNVYIRLCRIFDYIGHPWLNPNAIAESGKLHMIKERAGKLGMTQMEYLYSDKIKEVEYQYSTTITRSIFSRKYADYLK